MKQAVFRVAEREDVKVLLEIIQERIDWMDEQGIRQWNCTHYFDCYPRDYFEAGVDQGSFYLLEEQGRTVGVMALYTEDGRWDDDPGYFYLHHLATRQNCPGAGERMLRFAERLGKKQGKKGIRLDCQKENRRLNAYYEAQGYSALGSFVEGEYEGTKRVKLL